MMEQAPSEEWKRTRGRPRRDSNNHVVDRLLDATESLLRDTTHYELTERQIADAAGVHARMIHYYFSDKDGLIFGVMARYSDEISEKLQELNTLDPATPSLTRHIIKVVVEAYYAKPWIGKIGLSEFAKSSNIKELFVRKYGTPGRGHIHVQRAFDRLVRLGVYDRDSDTGQAALCLFAIVLAPHTLATLVGDATAEMDQFKTDAWVDFVADLFDRKLRASRFGGLPR
jgi:AcrR family transcriptional regulator